MNYEKKYKNLVDAVKVLRDNNPSDEGIQNWINDNVPELKENKDERIRKTLIENFKFFGGDYLEKRKWGKGDGLFVTDILAWLEKQGEKEEPQVYETENGEVITYSETDGYKVVEPKFKVGDVMRTLQEAANGMTDGMPVVVSIDEEYYHCTNELIAIKDQDDYEYPPTNRRQKKSAWCEEDEEKIDFIIALCADKQEECTYYSTMYCECNEIRDWLKSLKVRVQPQTKKWSEEDEKTLNRIRAIVRNDNSSSVEDILWLKSLKGRMKGE